MRTPIGTAGLIAVLVTGLLAASCSVRDGSSTARPTASIDAHAYEYEIYDTVEDLAGASSAVLVGRVAGMETAFINEGEAGTGDGRIEAVAISLDVVQVLKGRHPGSSLTFGWDAFLVDASGRRTDRFVMNGVDVPEIGAQYLLFLKPLAGYQREAAGDNVDYVVVNLDGVLRIEGESVRSTITGSDRLGRRIDGMRLSDVAALVSATKPSEG